MSTPGTVSIFHARRFAFAVGLAGLIACVIGWLANAREFFLGYLFGFLVWLDLALGSSGFLLVHHLTGGRWGCFVRSIFEAALSTLWILAVLLVSVLFGLRELYPWAGLHGIAYLNAAPFAGRAMSLFAI